MEQRQLQCPRCRDDEGLYLLVNLRSEIQVPANVEPELLELLAGRYWEREDQLACNNCDYVGDIEAFVVVHKTATDAAKIIVLKNSARGRTGRRR